MKNDSQLLPEQRVADLLHGSSLLAGGGGGVIEEAEELCSLASSSPHAPTLISISSLEPHALIVTPSLFGSCKPSERNFSSDVLLNAFDEYQALHPTPIAAFLVGEIGAVNVAIAVCMSALTGVPILDADFVGRSLPEISLALHTLDSLEHSYVLCTNSYGEIIAMRGVKTGARLSCLLRGLSSSSDGRIAAFLFGLPISKLPKYICEGMVSKTEPLGRATRIANQQGEDVSKVIADTSNGSVLFRGHVQDFNTFEHDGFSKGTVSIAGEHGKFFEIMFKNEFMTGRIDGIVCVTVPEIIILLDEDTGRPVLAPLFTVNLRVAVVVLPAPARYLKPESLKAFGPAYVGINAPFKSAIRGNLVASSPSM